MLSGAPEHPQLTTPSQPFERLLPHLPPAQGLIGAQPQRPDVTTPHELKPEHGQATVPPHPSLKLGHFPPAHSVALVLGAHAQIPGLPPPPQLLRPEQVHETMPPQPSAKLPHAPPAHSVALVFGVQPQTFGLPPPPHVLVPEQVPHETGGQVPWLAVPQLSPAGHVVGQELRH